MDYRNEWKHEISYSDLLVLRQKLRVIMKPDVYARPDGTYQVRSLYFDTPTDKALREKIDSVNMREKFRIRYYNDDLSTLHLEKKSKINGLGTKYHAPLSSEETQTIVDGSLAMTNGRLNWMPESRHSLIVELFSKMKSQGLKPKTIVDYVREPFNYAPGHVRVTLDYNIRTGLNCSGFLDPDCVTIPAGDPVIILEVKWDSFLPSVIRSAVQLDGRRTTAFSKYRICRIYG